MTQWISKLPANGFPTLTIAAAAGVDDGTAEGRGNDVLSWLLIPIFVFKFEEEAGVGKEIFFFLNEAMEGKSCWKMWEGKIEDEDKLW